MFDKTCHIVTMMMRWRVLSGVDVLYVSGHTVHAGVEGWALGGGQAHAVVTHGGVRHHHMVRVTRDQHGLRVNGRPLHLRVRTRHRRRPVHVTGHAL